MGARSSISRDPAIAKAVEAAFAKGKTIDEILEMLEVKEAGISRSAIGRYGKRYRPLIEETLRVKHAIEALDPHIAEGDMAFVRLARHKLQAEILRTLAAQDEEGSEPLSAKELNALARTLYAEHASEYRRIQIAEKRDEVDRKKAAAAAVNAARRAGASPAQWEVIRKAILGMKS